MVKTKHPASICVPDYTTYLSFKIMFGISLLGFVVFLILFIFEFLKGTNECLPGGLTTLSCANKTKYKLIWDFAWNTDNNGVATPSDNIFSFGVSATSKHESDSFWNPGEIASDGIVELISNGSFSTLESEIRERGQTPYYTLQTTTGTTRLSTEFEVDSEHKYLTLFSGMLPTPDWFVGISTINLCNTDNNWINDLSFSLVPIDAGFDSGTTFNAPAAPIDPPNTIAYLDPSILTSQYDTFPVGAVTLKRIDLN